MSVTLLRHAALEDVSVEAQAGIDGQGKVTYAAAIVVSGRVVRDAEFIFRGDGTQVKLVADVWIAGTESVLPNQGDRVTAAGLVGIVEMRTDGKTLGGVPDHVTLRLREEG